MKIVLVIYLAKNVLTIFKNMLKLKFLLNLKKKNSHMLVDFCEL